MTNNSLQTRVRALQLSTQRLRAQQKTLSASLGELSPWWLVGGGFAAGALASCVSDRGNEATPTTHTFGFASLMKMAGPTLEQLCMQLFEPEHAPAPAPRQGQRADNG